MYFYKQAGYGSEINAKAGSEKKIILDPQHCFLRQAPQSTFALAAAKIKKIYSQLITKKRPILAQS
jgi:hypothetical protein